MKKFSTITGQKVTEEPKPKVSKEQQELLEFKSNVLYLMDNFLTVRSNGSARQELIQNSISISGKEMFVEALLDLITKKNINEGIKILILFMNVRENLSNGCLKIIIPIIIRK